MTSTGHFYVLNVMSDDHPGIVSAVSSAVEALNGNIDACSQTVLGGFFTLIMIVSLPEEIEPDVLSQKICSAGGPSSGFQVSVRAAASEPTLSDDHEIDRFVVTAFGEDRPGIVRQFSEYLAGKDINIVDLYGELKGDEFVLIGQVEISDRFDLKMLQTDLEHIGKELGFTVKLQHQNVFVATNQLRLTH